MYGNGRSCHVDLRVSDTVRAGRFMPNGEVNFPPEFGRLFGMEGINGAVVVKCVGYSTKAIEDAADWLHREHGWEVSGFLTRK